MNTGYLLELALDVSRRLVALETGHGSRLVLEVALKVFRRLVALTTGHVNLLHIRDGSWGVSTTGGS